MIIDQFDKEIQAPKDNEDRIYSHEIYKLEKMQVGDSFLVPKSKRNGVNSAQRRFRKSHDFGFVMRTSEEGIRVWRIK